MNSKTFQKLLSAGYIEKPLFKNLPKLTNSNDKDISFIIPVYNAEEFLSKCLTSILNQKTHYDYEVICINDGSSDASLSILQAFANKFDRLQLKTQTNKGISSARNAGIELASGKYIGFIDNDDYVDESYVEAIMSAAEKYDADVVQIAYERITQNGETLYICNKGDFYLSKDQYEANFDKLRGTIWSGCFRRSIFEKIRFPEGYWYEDMINKVLLFRLTKNLVSLSNVLYHWVARQDSAMSSYWKSYNIQCVDQLYLPLCLQNYAEQNLGLKADPLFVRALIYEYAYILFLRTRKLPLESRKAIFSIAQEILTKYNVKGYVKYLPSSYKHFFQWNIICMYCLVKEELKKRFTPKR